MTKKERYENVLDWFIKNKPIAETELIYKSPYELLVAVILSAQCTDVRVNKIAPDFFKSFPTEKELAYASQDHVFQLIRSCSYPNNKAKNLIGMANTLINDFGGIVPSEVKNLEKLPGVGRKTANVIASVVYNKPVIAVDTHVFRVAARIGLSTKAKTPLETEKQLIRYIPKDKRAIAHHWLILHGRYVCLARKPKCEKCDLKPFCRFFQKQK